MKNLTDYLTSHRPAPRLRIGLLAERIAGGNEATIRKLLNDAGADPRLDEYANDPAETVDRDVVISLAVQRAGDRVGRQAALVLSDTREG